MAQTLCLFASGLSAARLIEIGTHSAWSWLWLLTMQRSRSKKFLSIVWVIAIDNNIGLGYDVGAPGLSAWAWRRCCAVDGVIRRSNQALPAPLDKIQNTKFAAPPLAGTISISHFFYEVEDIKSNSSHGFPAPLVTSNVCCREILNKP